MTLFILTFLHKIKARFVHWLLGGIHLPRLIVGHHSMVLGVLIEMDTQTPTVLGQIGMSVGGRPLFFTTERCLFWRR